MDVIKRSSSIREYLVVLVKGEELIQQISQEYASNVEEEVRS